MVETRSSAWTSCGGTHLWQAGMALACCTQNPGHPQPINVSKPMLQGAGTVGHSSSEIGFSGNGPMNGLMHSSWQRN